GWARSRAGVKNRLSLVEVTPDLGKALSPSRVIIDGADYPDLITLEGPKAYLRDDEYWIYAPAGGVAEGHQVVFRASSPYGPYEHRIVLEQGATAVNGRIRVHWSTIGTETGGSSISKTGTCSAGSPMFSQCASVRMAAPTW